MAKTKTGFIKVNRDFMHHPLYSNGTAFNLKEVFLDLNLRALYQDTQKPYRNSMYTYQRGQVEGSIRQFAEWWHMSLETVEKRLNALEECGYITRAMVQGRTVVNLLNYCIEQDNLGLGTNSNPNTDPNTDPNKLPNTDPNSNPNNYKKGKESKYKSIKKEKEKPPALDFFVEE